MKNKETVNNTTNLLLITLLSLIIADLILTQSLHEAYAPFKTYVLSVCFGVSVITLIKLLSYKPSLNKEKARVVYNRLIEQMDGIDPYKGAVNITILQATKYFPDGRVTLFLKNGDELRPNHGSPRHALMSAFTSQCQIWEITKQQLPDELAATLDELNATGYRLYGANDIETSERSLFVAQKK